MSHIPLESAFLCPCGLVGDSSTQCACGNALGLLCLAKVLNRESTEPAMVSFSGLRPRGASDGTWCELRDSSDQKSGLEALNCEICLQPRVTRLIEGVQVCEGCVTAATWERRSTAYPDREIVQGIEFYNPARSEL